MAVSSCGDARVGCSFTEDADRMADVIHFPVPSTSTTTATAGAPVSASDGTGDAPPSEEHLNLLRQWVLPRGQEWFYPVGPPPAEAPAPRRRALRSLTRRPCLGRDTVCLTNVPVLWLHVRQAPVADLGTSPHRRRHQHRLQQTRTLVPTAHPRRRGPMRGGCSAQSLRVLWSSPVHQVFPARRRRRKYWPRRRAGSGKHRTWWVMEPGARQATALGLTCCRRRRCRSLQPYLCPSRSACL